MPENDAMRVTGVDVELLNAAARFMEAARALDHTDATEAAVALARLVAHPLTWLPEGGPNA